MNSNPMLAKIRALLDKAESTTFPEEAEACRTKAEQLMAKYRIEEEQLIASDPTALSPVWGDTPLVKRSSFYRMNYWSMFWAIAEHAGIRVNPEWLIQDGELHLVAHTVGYEADLRYAEALFTSARMVFTEKLEPQINRSMTEEENIFRLRAAGIERVRIADMVWGMGSRHDKRLLSKVGRVYAAECKRRGETPAVAGRGVTGAAYREQYAEQFVVTLRVRLRRARQAASTGVVLHGRQERVNEAFYTRFPHLRPRPISGELESDRAPVKKCEKCAKSKRGACTEHYIPVGRSSGGRDYYSAAAVRGREAGAAAARNVDLGPGGRGKLEG